MQCLRQPACTRPPPSPLHADPPRPLFALCCPPSPFTRPESRGNLMALTLRRSDDEVLVIGFRSAPHWQARVGGCFVVCWQRGMGKCGCNRLHAAALHSSACSLPMQATCPPARLPARLPACLLPHPLFSKHFDRSANFASPCFPRRRWASRMGRRRQGPAGTTCGACLWRWSRGILRQVGGWVGGWAGGWVGGRGGGGGLGWSGAVLVMHVGPAACPVRQPLNL